MRDELRTNKIAGAVLGTALLILGLRQASEMIFAPGAMPSKPGDAITIQEDTSAGGAEPADVPPDWGTVLPTADVAAGATVSTKCQSCHNFANGGPNQTGPNLWGVIGRTPGTHPGFAYSAGMVQEGVKIRTWDFGHIYEFLKNPQAYVSGTKMSFVGLKKREDRINLIAWLRQQSSNPVPIPAPDPKAAAAAAAPASAPGSAPTPGTGTNVAAPAADASASAPAAGKGAPASDTAASTSSPTPAKPGAGGPAATTSTAVSGSAVPTKK